MLEHSIIHFALFLIRFFIMFIIYCLLLLLFFFNKRYYYFLNKLNMELNETKQTQSQSQLQLQSQLQNVDANVNVNVNANASINVNVGTNTNAKQMPSKRMNRYSDDIENIIRVNLVKKLKYAYPKIGLLYIVRRDKWEFNHRKLGETDNFLNRMSGYNNADDIKINCEYLIVCNHAKQAEAEIKEIVRARGICTKEKSNEFVQASLTELKAIFNEVIVEDCDTFRRLKDECEGIVIYTPRSLIGQQPQSISTPISTTAQQQPPYKSDDCELEVKCVNGLTFIRGLKNRVISKPDKKSLRLDSLPMPEYEQD